MATFNKKTSSLIDFPAAGRALKRFYVQGYTPVIAITAFLVAWVVLYVDGRIKLRRKQKPLFTGFLQYCLTVYITYSFMLCLMNDEVVFQLEGIPLMFAQTNRHF